MGGIVRFSTVRQAAPNRDYPGFPNGSGADLAEHAREQARRFGAEILLGREGVRGEILPGEGVRYLADGTRIVARATTCATGVDYRRLNVPRRGPAARSGNLPTGPGAGEAAARAASMSSDAAAAIRRGRAAPHFSRMELVPINVRGASLKRRFAIPCWIAYSPGNVRVLTNSEVTD